MIRLLPAWILRLLMVFFIASCGISDGSHNNTDNPLNSVYTRRFIIQDSAKYTKLTVINPWQGAENESFDYYIADSSSHIPGNIDEHKIIIRPVNKIICTSTTHIALLDTLGKLDIIKGVSGSEYVYNRSLRAEIDRGNIHDIGYENGYNPELIYKINPDLVLIYGIGSESATVFSKLIDLNIPVLFIADYLEDDPLARCEWIKVFGELVNKQDRADSIFSSIENEYTRVKDSIKKSVTYRKRVLLGLPFKDKWFISPGNSYISRLISDAGGSYLWEDIESSEAVPMSMEAVFQKAVNADVWLNTGIAQTIDDIRSVDNRLSRLKVVDQGDVYNNNKRVNKSGGNDYWESGIVNPHIILKDIAYILNPDIFPNHNLYYFTELQEKRLDE